MAKHAPLTEHSLELPLDVIKASTGFSLDIGGSVAKIVYRPKKDFKNGEPKVKAATGTGRVRMTLFAREKLGEVLDYIKEHCDMTSDENGRRIIYSTGLGGNEFKSRIEEELNVELNNLAEFDCFADACCLLLRTKSSSEIFKPKNQLGLDQATEMMKAFHIFKTAAESSGKGKMEFKQEADLEDYDSDEDARYPFILVMCGSAMGFFRVEEDSTYNILDMTNIAGRFFLGLVKFLTDITDFDEIASLVQQSDGKTVDSYSSDLVDPNIKDDVYASFIQEFRAFPFGKGLSDKSDKATKGDLIHSLLETICENAALLSMQFARAQGIPRVYFVGNFVNTPKAQQFITRTMQIKQFQPGQNVNYEFLEHGGFLGAVGAFCKAKDVRTEKTEDEERKKLLC